MGHSWSCRQAIELAAKYHSKVKGVVLISPCLFGHHPLFQTQNFSFFGLKRDKSIAYSFIKTAFFPQIIDYSFLSLCSKHFQGAFLHHFIKSFSYYGDQIVNKIYLLSEKKIPLLIIMGESDIVAPARMQLTPLQSLAFKLESHIIPHAGHMIPITHTKEMASIIENFTNQLENKIQSHVLRYSLSREATNK